MLNLTPNAILLLGVSAPLMGGTVVVTSLPDEAHPLEPLATLSGLPLANGTEVSVGAFPGMSDDEVLNAASTGGFTRIAADFVRFGKSSAIGAGVDQKEGHFEIAVQQNTSAAPSSWVGEEVSLLITKGAGQEFLVARFRSCRFAADPDTGLKPLQSLHLADAVIIVGNRYGSAKIATSPAPAAGSYSAWIAGFPNITDPAMRLPGADPDRDGRNNFLEYATGGDPASAADPSPCQILPDEAGAIWIRFSRAAGIGSIRHTVEACADLASPWQPVVGTLEADPNPPLAGSLNWMRMRVPLPMAKQGFFRLKSESSDIPD